MRDLSTMLYLQPYEHGSETWVKGRTLPTWVTVDQDVTSLFLNECYPKG